MSEITVTDIWGDAFYRVYEDSNGHRQYEVAGMEMSPTGETHEDWWAVGPEETPELLRHLSDRLSELDSHAAEKP